MIDPVYDSTIYSLYPQLKLHCTAIGNSDHTLKRDCGIIKVLLKGVSDGETKTKKLYPEFKPADKRYHQAP